MKFLLFLIAIGSISLSNNTQARGGGGGGGGGFRGGDGGYGGGIDEGGFRGDDVREDEGVDYRGDTADGFGVDREGDGGVRVSDDQGEANVNVRGEGDGVDNVNVRTASGRDYDENVAGPEGYRAGYVWRDGGYVSANFEPWVPYVAPFGLWAGWNIVTQPDYVQYPVYASYPVETAVQVALQNLGIYAGPIDGNAASCTEAIREYQEQNNLTVTGTITTELLGALGIQASEQ